MKKVMVWVLAIVCIRTFGGCSSGDMQKGPAFPLTQQEVESALAKFSIPWVIFDEENQRISDANRDGVIFTLRDPERKQSEAPDSHQFFCGGILTGILRGHRELDMTLDSRCHGLNGKTFAWENWKKEIILATALYCGAESKEEGYQALSQLDVPTEESFEVGVPLSGGYCTVKRKISGRENDRYILWIHFWESEELYRDARTPTT